MFLAHYRIWLTLATVQYVSFLRFPSTGRPEMRELGSFIEAGSYKLDIKNPARLVPSMCFNTYSSPFMIAFSGKKLVAFVQLKLSTISFFFSKYFVSYFCIPVTRDVLVHLPSYIFISPLRIILFYLTVLAPRISVVTGK